MIEIDITSLYVFIMELMKACGSVIKVSTAFPPCVRVILSVPMWMFCEAHKEKLWLLVSVHVPLVPLS